MQEINKYQMKISKHTVPSVTFNLTVDGQLIDQANKEKPLAFISGVGMMIPGFEEKLEGLKEGDTFEFEIAPEKAYGAYEEEAIVDLPKNVFEVEGKINTDIVKEGAVLPMQDHQGNQLEGLVLKIADDTIKMDFNHMLAGKTLHFTGEVVNVREAEKSELENGHVHGPDAHQHG